VEPVGTEPSGLEAKGSDDRAYLEKRKTQLVAARREALQKIS